MGVLQDAYISTFDGLWSIKVESKGNGARQSYAHRYSPGITERAAFVTLKRAAAPQNVKRSAQRLVHAYERRCPRAAIMSGVIERGGRRRGGWG